MSFISRAVGKSSFNALRVQRANYNFLAKAVAKPLGVQTALKGTISKHYILCQDN
jgi:hypothetical protein